MQRYGFVAKRDFLSFVLFLAMLEMIKGGRLWAEQRRPFGEITLVETAPEPA